MINPNTLFKALGDETRLRCLMLLFRERELCVCELEHALEETQPKISRHLALLRQSGVARDRREGRWIYYQLHPDLPAWARTVIQGAAEGTATLDPFRVDQTRLAAMPDRPTRCDERVRE